MDHLAPIRRGLSRKPDFLQALADLSSQLQSKEAVYTVFFVSNEYPMEKYANEIAEIMGPRAVGCTTAGEISGQGIEVHSISGFSFHGPQFKCKMMGLENLGQFPQESDSDLLEELNRINDIGLPGMGKEMKTFGLLILDGLSCREEIVTGAIGTYLADVPLVGASSGDGLDFQETFTYFNKKVASNRGALLLVATGLPFEIFKLQHFKASNKKMVVTHSDPVKRVVYELDGGPAADVYAEILGLKIEQFNADVFSTYPVMLRIGEENFVRSIQKVNPDKSLTFYCAIDDGIVLTLAEKEDLYQTTLQGLSTAQSNVGDDSPLLTFMFECILRRLEVLQMPEANQRDLAGLYQKFQATGFHTYGEQFGPLHINQTLTGVMIGRTQTKR